MRQSNWISFIAVVLLSRPHGVWGRQTTDAKGTVQTSRHLHGAGAMQIRRASSGADLSHLFNEPPRGNHAKSSKVRHSKSKKKKKKKHPSEKLDRKKKGEKTKSKNGLKDSSFSPTYYYSPNPSTATTRPSFAKKLFHPTRSPTLNTPVPSIPGSPTAATKTPTMKPAVVGSPTRKPTSPQAPTTQPIRTPSTTSPSLGGGGASTQRPTNSPVNGVPTTPGQTVNLTPFSLFYVFNQTSIPLKSDFDAVAEVTASYLISFFMQRVDGLVDLQTEMIDHNFQLFKPTVINFTATALFSSDATVIPSVADLDNLLNMAFQGPNLQAYIKLLNALPSSNVFSTTSDVYDDTTLPPASTRSQTRNKTSSSSHRSAIMASGGAGLFISLLLGAIMFRRRDRYYDELLDKAECKAIATVAGDTYRGTSTMSSGSDAQSLARTARYGDDSHVVEGHSDWALSTKAATEDGYSEASDDENEPITSSQEIFQEEGDEPRLSESNLERMEEEIEESRRSSEHGKDRDVVPMKVVDLIRIWTTR